LQPVKVGLLWILSTTSSSTSAGKTQCLFSLTHWPNFRPVTRCQIRLSR